MRKGSTKALACVAIAVILNAASCQGATVTGSEGNKRPQILQGADTTSDYRYPVGDARRCIEQAMASLSELKRFEVLPGLGWDNLRNKEMAEVVSYNFSQCKVTDDGRLLLPDHVFTVPLKTSSVNVYAEIIDSWTNSSSTTSYSVNANANIPFEDPPMVASGSFSFEHTRLKTHQVEDNSVTARVQMRYNRYQAQLDPDPVLSPGFKSRLLHMAASLQLGQKDQAVYDAQLLVRDYGTHYLTSVTAGAALVKDDYLKTHYVTSSDDSKTSITYSAGLNFLKTFGISTKYGFASENKVSQSYNDSITHSFVMAHGGPLLRADPDTEKWIDGIDINIVPLDREGEPLSSLVTERLLPELPAPTVWQLEKLVHSAIMTYYEMNTIRGCTKMGAPNFSFSANFDDGSCHKEYTNMTLGGVYQTCTPSGQYDSDPCSGLTTVNPLTGSTSCPAHYTPILLHTGTKPQVENRRSCHRCWIFAHCCHNDQLQSSGTYSAYWCAARETVPQNSGYMFGGIYTKTSRNLVTDDHSCPSNFYPRNLLLDLTVCLSDDFELDAGQAMPFGGFFSCEAGNPLASSHLVNAKAEERPRLAAFMAKNAAPKRACPEGYSQHMATLTQDGCSIHYCIRSGFLSGPLSPSVKRPPFVDRPVAVLPQDNLLMFDLDSSTWMKNEKAREYQKVLMTRLNVATPTDGGSAGISPGAAAGVSVAVTLGCVLLATAVLVAVHRRRARRQRPYSRLVEQPCGDYGTSGGTTSGGITSGGHTSGGFTSGGLINRDSDHVFAGMGEHSGHTSGEAEP